MSVIFGETNRAAKTALISVMLLVAVGSAQGERYLTIAEAQKVCFPRATRFEERTFRCTPDQIRAVETRSGVKVAIRETRVWFAYASDKLAGVMFFDQVIGKHELIDYLAAITPDGRVQQIEILEYRESHGGQIRGARWRAQFRGKKSDSPLKLNDDIYNISGATMSCRHVTEGVRRLLATFDIVVRPALPPGDGVRKPAGL